MSKMDKLRADPDQLIEDDSAEMWNDAQLWGTDSAEYRAALDLPMHFTPGVQYTDTKKLKRHNTPDDGWKGNTAPLRVWIEGAPSRGMVSARGLSRHPVAPHKDGECIVFGHSAGGGRTAKAMVTMSAMVLDIDAGGVLEDVAAKIERMGLLALIYTSFNDQKTTLDVSRDKVMKAAKTATDPTLDQVRAFLAADPKSAFTADFLDSVEIEDTKLHTEKGLVIRLRTAAQEKFRVVFPLAVPVVIGDLAPTHAAGLDLWADKITGLGADLVGVAFDTSCTDPSRLFFTPRHPKDRQGVAIIVRGRPLTFEEVQARSKDAYLAQRRAATITDPFALAGMPTGGDAEFTAPVQVFSPSGRDLTAWHKGVKERFLLADMLEAVCPDRCDTRQNKADTFHTICPFEDEGGHGPTGGACMASNPDAHPHGVWGWFCKHASCDGLDKLEFIAQALAEGWFDESELDNEEWLLAAYEDETPDDAGPDAEDSAAQDDIAGSIAELAGEFEDRKDWLIGYKVTGGAITRGKKDGKPVALCGVFDVVGRSSNADGTEAAGRIISFVNENGKRVELTLLMADLVTDGRAIIARLAGAGLPIYAYTKEATDNLLALLRSLRPKRLVPTMQAPGWVRGDTGAVLGYLTPTGDYIRAFENAPAVRLVEAARAEVVKPGGTLAGWQGAADAAIQRSTENPYWLLTLCAGFAGPLLGLTGGDPCGLALSGRTSKGKSLAQRLGASVWASPRTGDGVLHSMNSTSNAIEDLATKGSEAVLMLDDVGALQDKRALSGILFGLSGGSTKNRKAGRGAGLTKRETFRPYVVLSSEQDIRAEVMGAGDTYRGGLAGRFADVDVTNGQDAPAKELAALEAASQHFGHAGPAFIRHLIATGVHSAPETLAAKIKTMAGKLARRGLDARQEPPAVMRRAAEVFAYPLLGGLLAVEAGLIGAGDKLRAAQAVRDVVENAWDGFVETGGAGAARGGADLIDSFRSFIAREIGARIIETTDDASAARGGVIGWYDDDFIYLDWSLLADPARLGIDFAKRDELAKALGEVGMLVKPPKGYPQRKLPATFGGVAAGKDPREVKNLKVIRKTLGI